MTSLLLSYFGFQETEICELRYPLDPLISPFRTHGGPVDTVVIPWLPYEHMILLCTLYDVYMRIVHVVVIASTFSLLTDNASSILFYGEIAMFTCHFMDFLVVTLKNYVDGWVSKQVERKDQVRTRIIEL